jgi:hypothetical protein
MSDYTNSKPGIGAVYPINCIGSTWGQVEPLITPALLKMRHLFGIPLVSAMIDPVSRTRQVMTDPILEDSIERAVSIVELDCKIDIFPKQYRDKEPFDRNLYESFMYFSLGHRPVMSIDKISITPANQEDAYTLPPDWVETANIRKGQVNVLPITASFQNAGFLSPQGGHTGSMFAAIMGTKGWVPAYWQIEYTCGFPDAQIPRVVNELIGVHAAIDILAILASTNAKNNGNSLSLDGLSQSQTTMGPQIYDARIQILSQKKDELTGKIKSLFGTKLFSGTL